MRSYELFQDVITRFLEQYPGPSVDFGRSGTLTEAESQRFVQLVNFTRNLQMAHPAYELVYHHLVHEFVLRGSRTHLLASLDRRLQAATSGQCALVLVEGVSGIGKTSLAMTQEVRAQELGAAFVVARCYEQGASPFWLWQEIVQAIGKLTSASFDDLPVPFGKNAGVNSIQNLAKALAEWLMTCTTAQPLVILIDDLHWADSDSLEILNHLAGRLSQCRILFIATYRSEGTHHGHPLYRYLPLIHRNPIVETLRLSPLSIADTTQLVTAYHGACHPQLADYLFQRAEGHLLFTVELLHDLVDQNLLTQNDEGLWLPPDQSVPVPTLLKQVILERVARLGEVGETILSQASVVGETWHLALVENLTGLPEDEFLDAVEQAVRVDLIKVADERQEIYRFSHGLIREVLYKQHSPRRRKHLHERIGAYLENQIPLNLAQLSHHFYEAENWKKALEYSFKAGQESSINFANNRAIDLYQKALEAAQRTRNDIDLQLQVRLYRHIGDVYRILDQNLQAENAYRRMRDAARDAGDTYTEGAALAQLILTHLAQYQLDVAEQTAQEAIRLAEQVGDPKLLAQVYGSLAKLLLVRGQLDASSHYLDQYSHYSEVLNDAAAQSDMLRQKAYLEVWAGRYVEAEAVARQCLEQGMKSGNQLSITGGYQILSIVLIETGKYLEAYQSLSSILNQTTLNETYHHQLPRLLNHMGYLFLELGDPAQALTWDQQALEVSHNDKGVSRFEIQRYCLMNAATDLIHLGRLDEAGEYLLRFEAMKTVPDYARFRYLNRYLLLRSELHLSRQQFKKAIEFAQEARSFAEQYGATKNIAKSHWLEGQALLEMGQLQTAIDHFQQALTLANTMHHGSLRWKIGLSLAKGLARIGESPDEVIQTAQMLIDQIRRTLTNSPLRESFKPEYWLDRFEAKQNAEKPAYPAGLTQREVEILRLVASGATNQQIADALVISPRTVNTHITNILNKTGCENRTAASAFAMKHNLLST